MQQRRMSPGEGTTGNNHPGASVMMPLAVASPHVKIRAQNNSKNFRIMKQYLNDDENAKYILRQIGFGAMLGAAFLCVVYFGGLLAQCVGNF